MANEIESISYIKIGSSNHPIDAVTFQGNEVSSFVSKSVNDLTNYYNKTEIEGLMGALINFHYEIYASTASVSEPEDNVLYLIGPSGQGDDKYEEYIYPDETTGWVKIGDTTLDLSGYVTTSALNSTLSGYLTGVNFNGSAASVSNGVASISVSIPAEVTESTVAGWGFTKNAGTLTSESDPVFTSSVAYSISSADITNWNSKTSNTGTLTGVTFNGTSASISNGVANISVSIDSLPSVSAADNGKCLRVVNGQWTLVSPQTIYTGDGTPSGTLGNDGDIYIQ